MTMQHGGSERRRCDDSLIDDLMRKLNGDLMRKLNGELMRTLSGDLMRKLSGDLSRKLSGEQARKLEPSGEQMRKLEPGTVMLKMLEDEGEMMGEMHGSEMERTLHRIKMESDEEIKQQALKAEGDESNEKIEHKPTTKSLNKKATARKRGNGRQESLHTMPRKLAMTAMAMPPLPQLVTVHQSWCRHRSSQS